MVYFEIPLNTVNQAFNVQLAGINYRFRLVWRDVAEFWALDIGYPDGTALINGLPLTLGNNILKQHQHLIKGVMFVVTDDNSEPTYSNLGTRTHLFWIPPQ